MKKYIFILVLILLVIVVAIAFFANSESTYKQNMNKQLDEINTVSLLKLASLNFDKSENGEYLTDCNMIKFALSYMQVIGGYNIIYIDSEEVAQVQKEDIESVVEYIFGRTIDYSKIAYSKDNSTINVPVILTTGDAQIYKFKNREYNESNNTYKVYIDVLEAGPSRFSELEEYSVIEYSAEDILFTMIFEYKEVDGRKVLLDYNVILNW